MADDRRETLVRMFPEYDVDMLIASMTTATVEQIADWCLNNLDRVPKKRRAEKRKAPLPSSSDGEQDDSDADSLDFDDIADGLLLDRLVKELLSKLKKEMSLQNNKIEGNVIEVRYFLAAVYPKLRMDFFKQAYQESGSRLCATLIMGFFVSNKLTQRLRDSMQNPQSNMWLLTDSLTSTRKKNVIDIFETDMSYYPESLFTQITKFVGIMNALTEKYPAILNRLQLLPDALNIRLEVPDDIEKFSCGVCFDEYTINRRIMCGLASASEAERHSFCRTCVRQQAQAATEEMPLAQDAVGLKCMEVDCKNAILYSAVRNLIPKNVRRKIDERIMEENLGKAGLNLERCRDCNFAIEMEESKEENRVFVCPNCEKDWCRLCDREWSGEHFGLSCAELDDKNKVDKKQRELERRLNEAVIRKCRCGLQFTKSDGCNKMTCRCGATQCYICRKESINYTHFCQHVRNPGVQQCVAAGCDKKCTLWADANQLDQQVMDRIRAEVSQDPDVPGPSRVRAPTPPPQRHVQFRPPHQQQRMIPPLGLYIPPPQMYVPPPPPPMYQPPVAGPAQRRHHFGIPDEALNFGFNYNNRHRAINFNVNFNDNNLFDLPYQGYNGQQHIEQQLLQGDRVAERNRIALDERRNAMDLEERFRRTTAEAVRQATQARTRLNDAMQANEAVKKRLNDATQAAVARERARERRRLRIARRHEAALQRINRPVAHERYGDGLEYGEGLHRFVNQLPTLDGWPAGPVANRHVAPVRNLQTPPNLRAVREYPAREPLAGKPPAKKPAAREYPAREPAGPFDDFDFDDVRDNERWEELFRDIIEPPPNRPLNLARKPQQPHLNVALNLAHEPQRPRLHVAEEINQEVQVRLFENAGIPREQTVALVNDNRIKNEPIIKNEPVKAALERINRPVDAQNIAYEPPIIQENPVINLNVFVPSVSSESNTDSTQTSSDSANEEDNNEMDQEDFVNVNIPLDAPNRQQEENVLIDLTEVDDGPVVETDMVHVRRIHDLGERFEVLPMDVNSFVTASSQLASDWTFAMKLVSELSTANEKLLESFNVSDTGTNPEKSNQIREALNLFDTVAQKFDKNQLTQLEAQKEKLSHV